MQWGLDAVAAPSALQHVTDGVGPPMRRSTVAHAISICKFVNCRECAFMSWLPANARPDAAVLAAQQQHAAYISHIAQKLADAPLDTDTQVVLATAVTCPLHNMAW